MAAARPGDMRRASAFLGYQPTQDHFFVFLAAANACSTSRRMASGRLGKSSSSFRQRSIRVARSDWRRTKTGSPVAVARILIDFVISRIALAIAP